MVTLQRAGSPEGEGGGSATVLVIEDDQDLCGCLAESLESVGYGAIKAHDGLSGWRAFEEHNPHLVVVDLGIPLMSGFRLLRLLRATANLHRRRVPAIVISGYDVQQAADVIAETRPEAYLQKPFATLRFLEVVEWLLQSEASRWLKAASEKPAVWQDPSAINQSALSQGSGNEAIMTIGGE